LRLATAPSPFARCGVLFAAVGMLACNPPGTVREGTADVVTKSIPTQQEEANVKPRTWQCPEALVRARRGGTAPDRYIVPAAEARQAMAELMTRLAAQESLSLPPDVASAAARFGYQIASVPEMPGTLLLSEVESARHGGGAYLLRPGSRSSVVVQAPHTFFDENTLPLACDLFERGAAAALFVDTAHRYKAAEVDERGAYPADLAHATDSLFQAATEGLLRARPQLTVVQVHGFGPRESPASVVVSAGTTQPGAPVVQGAKAELSALAVGPVLRFPEDTSELGATKNVQGAAVRAAGGTFLHVEIAATLRTALVSDEALRARFLDAMVRSLSAR